MAAVIDESGTTEPFIGTAEEIAVAFGLRRPEATRGDETDADKKAYINVTGLLRFLEQVGTVKPAGTRPNKRGKGKGASLWRVPANMRMTMP